MKYNNKSAVLYDFLQVQGGAEMVTLGLFQHFQHSDLITGFINEEMPINFDNTSGKIIPLTSLTSVRGWQAFKTCRAFEKKTSMLGCYNRLLFSGSYAPLAIKNSRAERNVYYCHTPPRFVYDLKDYYLDSMSSLYRPALKALISYLQPRYEDALLQMDVIYANSENVKNRLEKFVGVKSEVLYPPCRVDRFDWLPDKNYFLSTARLEDYKRVDLVVKAFMQMPEKYLVVTSGGSQLEALKRMAKGYKNIKFTGWVNEDELAGLIGQSLATIYIPKNEDFGISPVESMGAGKPVIGVNDGGLQETIISGETGWLLPSEPTENDIIDLVSSLSNESIINMRNRCLRRAQEFSTENFYNEIEKALIKN